MSTIEFVTGNLLRDTNYGDNTYGLLTYGAKSSDAHLGVRFRVYSVPIDYPRQRTWRYRVGDIAPDVVVAVANDEGTPIASTDVASAELVLTRYGARDRIIVLPLAIEATQYRRVLEPTDLDEPGEYRCAAKLTMQSGRLLTVPTDDGTVFSILERETVPTRRL